MTLMEEFRMDRTTLKRVKAHGKRIEHKKQCFYGINCWVFSKYVEQQSHNFLGDMFYYNLSVKYLLCFLL